MKKVNSIIRIFIIGLFVSCSSEFLDEQPRDFLTTSNAFKTSEDFNASVNNLYQLVRGEFYTDLFGFLLYKSGTDLFTYIVPGNDGFGTYTVTLDPTGKYVKSKWDSWYKIIAECNTIISQLSHSNLSESQKKLFEVKAIFFRGLAYRTLGYLYGGVPIVLQEITEPKLDFTRATRKQVYEQAIADLLFAAENLPDIVDVRDGEISNLAAYHLLSEVYIANEENVKAINAATIVIDHPATSLMRNRFGSRANQPGDVYWDLFQRNNQNRKSGNSEGIWVIQFETDVPGGASVTSGRGGGYQLEFAAAPQVSSVRLQAVAPFIWATSTNSGGRGVGLVPTLKYFSNIIWQTDFNNDIRNSKYNFIREFVIDNPAHPRFGEVISTETPPAGVIVPSRGIYAFQAKITTPGDHPEQLYANKETQLLKSSAGATYTDQYMSRLAETYLLRAEAYFRNGNSIGAAADINVVRERANAAAVNPGDITIDYILDERMRELGVEEMRRLTLVRMGKLYDRVMKSHPPRVAGGLNTNLDNIQPYHELWPIPFSVIEANTGAVLEQNPGYN